MSPIPYCVFGVPTAYEVALQGQELALPVVAVSQREEVVLLPLEGANLRDLEWHSDQHRYHGSAIASRGASDSSAVKTACRVFESPRGHHTLYTQNPADDLSVGGQPVDLVEAPFGRHGDARFESDSLSAFIHAAHAAFRIAFPGADLAMSYEPLQDAAAFRAAVVRVVDRCGGQAGEWHLASPSSSPAARQAESRHLSVLLPAVSVAAPLRSAAAALPVLRPLLSRPQPPATTLAATLAWR